MIKMVNFVLRVLYQNNKQRGGASGEIFLGFLFQIE